MFQNLILLMTNSEYSLRIARPITRTKQKLSVKTLLIRSKAKFSTSSIQLATSRSGGVMDDNGEQL